MQVEREIVRMSDDNVPIYEGDSIWWVNCKFEIREFRHVKRTWCFVDTDKYFSTEQAAKEWVRLNEKRYSLQDIIDKFK